MKELFYTLGAIALCGFIGISPFITGPVVIIVLFFDYALSKKKIKDMADLEAFKLFMATKGK